MSTTLTKSWEHIDSNVKLELMLLRVVTKKWKNGTAVCSALLFSKRITLLKNVTKEWHGENPVINYLKVNDLFCLLLSKCHCHRESTL